MAVSLCRLLILLLHLQDHRDAVREKPWSSGLLGLPCFTPLYPSLERGGTFCRLLTHQQSFYADILIEFRPMHAITCAADLNIGALSQCAMGQTRIPANGHSNCTTIFEINRHSIVCHGYTDDSRQDECHHCRRRPIHVSR